MGKSLAQKYRQGVPPKRLVVVLRRPQQGLSHRIVRADARQNRESRFDAIRRADSIQAHRGLRHSQP